MSRTLNITSTGDDVKFLQERLNSRPPTALPLLVVDGNFGQETFDRVKEYQANNALAVDGIVEPLTWGSLLGHTTSETTGFFVLERNVYDSQGTNVLLRGVNKMCVFDNDDPFGLISFPEIKKTGANTVRIVWAITSDLQLGGPATSTATLDALITNAKANHLIPMIELHDATGEWGRLNDLVDYWTQPAVVTIVQKHQPYLLLNIGNEVGDETITQDKFIGDPLGTAGYSKAIQQMRAAGIHTPLVIDASDWGKNLMMLNNAAAPLLADDPDGNLIFSVHLYWSLSCGADMAYIQSNLQEAVNLGYPLIVGEFARYGGFPCNNPAASICSAGGEIDYKTILTVCHDLQIGWYAWEWGPGNALGTPPDPLCVVLDMTPDRLFVNLKPGWAEEVAISSPFSIQNTSVTPASI